MNKRIISISVLLLILFLLTVNLRYSIFNLSFYEKEFEKHNVYNNIPKETALNTTIQLLNYLEKDTADQPPNIALFNEKENSHLLNVKQLIQKGIIFYYIISISLLILLYCIIKNRSYCELSISLITAGIIIDVFFLILLMTNFNISFEIFHKIFFKGNYLFSPESNLIKLFPLKFFYDFFIKIAVLTLIEANIFIIAGIFLKKRWGERK